MRKGVVTVGLGLAIVVGVVGLSLGIVTWVTRTSGPAVRVASEEGGFSVAVPKGWTVEKRRPTTDDHRDFMVGHENAAFGFLQRGGFWVARWAVGADASPETVRARVRADQRNSPRDNWTVGSQQLAGHAAVVQRFTESPVGFGRLRLGQKRLVVYDVIDGGFNYQIGLWTLPRPGSAKAALDKIAASIELFAPRAWTAEIAGTGARLTLPGGWAQYPSDIKGTVLHALAPNDPTDAWVYVFRFTDSPTATLRGARRNIPANGGVIIGQRDVTLAGQAAVRLDFTFPDGDRPPARDTEWLVSDGEGGTLVLVVGVRSGDPDIAERIASGWKY